MTQRRAIKFTVSLQLRTGTVMQSRTHGPGLSMGERRPTTIFVPQHKSSQSAAAPPLRPIGNRVASRRDAARRRRHEFGTNRIGYGFAQDPIDLGLGRGVERPAGDIVDGPQLIRTPRAPQRRGNALIEHPTNRQVNNALVETLPCKLIKLLHGGHILYEPRLHKFWVSTPQVVAIEDRTRLHSSGQQAAAQRSISECRYFIFAAIR